MKRCVLVSQNKYGETEATVLKHTDVLNVIEHDLDADDEYIIRETLYDATTIEEVNQVLLDNNLNGRVYPLKGDLV